MGELKSNEIINVMWSDFDGRVVKICKKYDLHKQELAANLGLPKGRLSQLKGNACHSIAYRILLEYPEINARWLLFGEGEMLDERRPSPTAEVPQHPDLLTSTATTPQQLGSPYMVPITLYHQVVEENGRLKERLGEKVSRGLASA